MRAVTSLSLLPAWKRVVTLMWAYELIEGQTGNLMASFETEAEALTVISQRVQQHGPESVASIVLVRVDIDDEDGAMEMVAQGSDLVALAPQLA